MFVGSFGLDLQCFMHMCTLERIWRRGSKRGKESPSAAATSQPVRVLYILMYLQGSKLESLQNFESVHLNMGIGHFQG